MSGEQYRVVYEVQDEVVFTRPVSGKETVLRSARVMKSSGTVVLGVVSEDRLDAALRAMGVTAGTVADGEVRIDTLNWREQER